MKIVGLVLAGGSGNRLGLVRKADLRVGGESLLARVAGRLEMIAPPLLISTRGERQGIGQHGVALPDLDIDLAGPLAGIAAAARHLAGKAEPDTVVVSVAVDTPFLPLDYVSRLVSAMGGVHSAAQAGWRGNGYPTNAAWCLSALADLPRLAANGGRHSSPKGLLRTLGAPLVDWADTHDEDPFANLNTLDDLVSLTRRARDEAP
ncbi:molybdenum cofactor guanylyltransferase [Devosia sp. CAU 1758]